MRDRVLWHEEEEFDDEESESPEGDDLEDSQYRILYFDKDDKNNPFSA